MVSSEGKEKLLLIKLPVFNLILLLVLLIIFSD